MENDKIKYLLIWDRLGDYHRARVKALRGLAGEENVLTADLGVADALYRWENNSDQRHYQLSKKAVDQADPINRLKNYRQIIKQHHVNVVAIAGYGRLEYILMMVYAKLRRIKVILFAESWYPGNYKFDKLKGWILSLLVDGFFVSGIRAEKHFHKRLGIPLEKIVKGYSVVDNDHFKPKSVQSLISSTVQKSIKSTNQQINLPRRQAGKSTNIPYLLCVARYSPEKNLPFLIEAYRLTNKFRSWKLVLIGDGPQKSELKSMIGKDDNWIRLEGWKSYDELPLWYQGASAVILPSTFEPWGLVINEALTAGCKVLVSNACGCADDFRKFKQLSTFDPWSLGSLCNALHLAEQKSEGKIDKEFEIQFSCNTWAEQLKYLADEIN